MTIKGELIQKLEQVSETELVKVLEFVRSLKSTALNANPLWQAYLASKRERAEVYYHLANSLLPDSLKRKCQRKFAN